MQAYDRTSSVAAIEAGTLVSTFLFGISALQTVTYFSQFPDDRLFIKSLVVFISALQLGYAVAIAYFHYTFTALLATDNNSLMMPFVTPRSIEAASILSTVISAIVQAFLVDRMRRFTRANVFASLLWFLIFVNFARGCFVSAVSFIHTLADFNRRWRWLAVSGRFLDAGIDIVIAVALSARLYQQRKLAFRRTTRLIDRVIIISINTGLLASAMALITTICFLSMPTNLVYIGLYSCTAQVYANTFFASLNIRAKLRDDVDHLPSLQFALSHLPAGVPKQSMTTSNGVATLNRVYARVHNQALLYCVCVESFKHLKCAIFKKLYATLSPRSGLG